MTRPAPRLTVSALEGRAVPAVFGNPWADPGHLTISFAPDGTDIRGAASGLFRELGADTAAWQREVLRAFQAWAGQANIDVSVVPDGGAPFGAAGPIQGDARHGDIRIGARPLGPDQLAITAPFDLFGGWAGEVVLNTDQAFNLGGTGRAYDLFTVALHEAGHAFSLDHSGLPGSAVWEVYTGPVAGPSADDVAHLRALYGARTPDRFDAAAGSGTVAATPRLNFINNLLALGGTDGTVGAVPFVAAADLTTGTDVDLYQVQVPAGVKSFQVSLRTAGLSLLTARVSVLDGAGRVVASAAATDPARGDLTLTVRGAAGGTYTVRVEAADAAFGIGAYRLAVGAAAQDAVNDPVISGLVLDDERKNDTADKATGLGKIGADTDARWDVALRATVSDPADVDWYKVSRTADAPATLVVAVWGTQAGGVDPVVLVTDAGGAPVAAQVLANDDGTFTVQVPDTVAGQDYLIQVAPDPATGLRAGGYFLGADFRAAVIGTTRLAGGTASPDAPAVTSSLVIDQAGLWQLVLGAQAGSGGVRLSVRDATGVEVLTLYAAAGQTVSGLVMLAPGTYTLAFTADGPAGLGFTLDGIERTDPIGIAPTDTSTAPSTDPSSTTTTTTTTTTKSYPLYTRSYLIY